MKWEVEKYAKFIEVNMIKYNENNNLLWHQKPHNVEYLNFIV